MRDINRTFELTGVAGGQRVFYYEADTKNHVLYLQDKNRGARNQENREFLVNNQDMGGQRSAGNGTGRNGAGKSGINESRKSADKAQARQDSIDAVTFIPKEALAIIGPEDPKIDPIARSTRRTKGILAESKPAKRNRMILSYTALDGGNQVILQGINEQKDSIYVVLNRYEKKYALSKSTLNAGTYE